MNSKNNNYRVMKFLEPVNKQDKGKGYVRLDIRGTRGTIIVSAENVGDVKKSSEVYLYKDRLNKIKLGNINSKKGMIKKIITFGNNHTVEDYNICGVVKDNKILLYANLFNAVNISDVKKLEESNSAEEIHIDTKAERKRIEKNTRKISKLDNETKNEDIKSLDENDSNTDVMKNEDVKAEEEEKEERSINTSHADADNTIAEDMQQNENINEENYNDELEEIPEKVKKSEISEDIPEKANSEQDSSKSDEVESETVNDDEDVTDSVGIQGKNKRYKNKFEKNLYTVLEEYNELEPLSVKIKDMLWWYIPYDDRGMKNGFLPYYNQIISSYYPYPMSSRVTTCSNLMKKYGHYIFGIYKENDNIKRFVYGIPGDFKRDEQPYKGVTGFKNWSYKNKKINGNYGYWLAFVDSNTGEVTDPPKIVLSK